MGAGQRAGTSASHAIMALAARQHGVVSPMARLWAAWLYAESPGQHPVTHGRQCLRRARSWPVRRRCGWPVWWTGAQPSLTSWRHARCAASRVSGQLASLRSGLTAAFAASWSWTVERRTRSTRRSATAGATTTLHVRVTASCGTAGARSPPTRAAWRPRSPVSSPPRDGAAATPLRPPLCRRSAAREQRPAQRDIVHGVSRRSGVRRAR